MDYKNYSPAIWDQIHKTLDTILQQDSKPVAAFDADGTLWDTDLGEGFFDYLIAHKLVPLPQDPWEHYEEMKKDPAGPERAYLWLAQILKDVPLDTVLKWSHDAVKENPVPFFPEQKKLVELLISKGVNVYIVTASVKWAVDPGSEIVGLSPENVIGIETEVVSGKVTDKQKGIITYKNGKWEALMKRAHKRPFLASGNTMGDWHLLESATHLRLAVTAARPDDRLFRTEQELQKNAAAQGWITHKFA
jgi:phosphoserine phosphatase